MKNKIFALVLGAIIAGCGSNKPADQFGNIDRLDPAVDQIIGTDAVIEKLADGYEWSEGPLWVESHQMLLFSDVLTNATYKWTEAEGARIYLQPSGYTGTTTRGGELGSNGLLLNPEGQLVLCQHGDRRMAAMVAPLDDPQPLFVTLAETYNDQKFSSPNDAVYDKDGNLYFTDPPYGLANDTLKEIPFQGVYKLLKSGEVRLLIDSLTRPNGIALSPDQTKLYVANSDPDKARWYEYQLKEDSIVSGKVFYDATELTQTMKGLPDGLKVDASGNLFASAPGGIFIFKPDATLIGKMNLPDATSNCALADNDKTLYITSDMNLLRIKMRN